jgi:hypothetical protein
MTAQVAGNLDKITLKSDTVSGRRVTFWVKSIKPDKQKG